MYSVYTCIQLVWKFDMVEREFLLISSFYLCFVHFPSFAYYLSSQINLLSNSFYTKHLVLKFSIDVVSTLSN